MTRSEALSAAEALPGWCHRGKLEYLYDTAAARSGYALEVGVLAGKSFLPIAAGLRGTSIAVDPWSNQIAAMGLTIPEHRDYWLALNLGHCEQLCREAVRSLPTQILKMTSVQAATMFRDGAFQVIHIDGNHTESEALADFKRWFPKLAPGGVFVVDDVGSASWPGVDAAIPWLDERATRVRDEGDNFAAWSY